MNKIASMIGIALISGISFAADPIVQSVYNGADTANAIRIKYNGSGAATISNTINVITLTDAGTANTITMSAASTYADLLGSISAATNSSGVANFQAELVNAISTDTVSNKVVAASDNTALTDGKWHEVLPIDTSAALFYSSASYGDGIGARVLKNIFGDITGTGNVTLGVYVDGALKYSKVIQSPAYSSVDGTIVSTNANVSAEVSLGSGIPVGGGQKVAVRATRATTATTGGIGASFEARK